ncbi:type 1 glutamine amidotransferase [Desulfopila sp. IMCC35008]|uniref:type 1 glutamine amidotransferase n=1 Tax=Desulfopila sp. IMCC35008 TaxID=2653858 RepID=UPI0013D7121E|nr:gamma-glutamyl-gamma-aminobutyrate hydrolase family protein [Desulfopila sp. IMCC35008]
MRAHYLQHVPFEGLGSIENWLNNSGYEITSTQLYQPSAKLPDVDEIDLLIVLGGPMSVNDVQDYQWLLDEMAFVRKVIEKKKPVLGICLGAQLIAKLKEAEVYPNSEKEIGWFPVHFVKTSTDSTFQFPEEVVVFHWHGETFTLPQGAVQIARSQGCKNQAFQIGRNVIGLQFHLETTPNSAEALVENCHDELVDGRYIQKETDILSASTGRYNSINKLMADILSYLHKSIS